MNDGTSSISRLDFPLQKSRFVVPRPQSWIRWSAPLIIVMRTCILTFCFLIALSKNENLTNIAPVVIQKRVSHLFTSSHVHHHNVMPHVIIAHVIRGVRDGAQVLGEGAHVPQWRRFLPAAAVGVQQVRDGAEQNCANEDTDEHSAGCKRQHVAPRRGGYWRRCGSTLIQS